MKVRATISGVGARTPANRSFERELAILESMSHQVPDKAGVERLQRVLGHENNYLVAKAARLIADHGLAGLLPEVLIAYDRFFDKPVKTDPQCWAKNALVKTLVALECHDPAVYLRGLRHTQEEPVWGGQSDTAGALRATSTQALVVCRELTNEVLLDILLTPLVDHDKAVRIEAARAIGQVGGSSAALLLKLRVMLRKDEAEVLGACFSALLNLEYPDRSASIKLVSEFLDEGEESAAEAAFALAETHNPMALDALIERRRKGADMWFGSVLDNAIALTRLPDGFDFLLKAIETDERQANSALEAISRVHQSSEVRTRVAVAVAAGNNERIHAAFRNLFPA